MRRDREDRGRDEKRSETRRDLQVLVRRLEDVSTWEFLTMGTGEKIEGCSIVKDNIVM